MNTLLIIATVLFCAVRPASPMTAPVDLKSLVLSPFSVLVQWTDTSLDTSQHINDKRFYTLRYRPTNTIEYSFVNATDLKVQLDNLRPSTQYEFDVRCVLGDQMSLWSLGLANTTLDADPSISQPPRSANSTVGDSVTFSCTVANKGTSKLSWQKMGSPADNLFIDTFKTYSRRGESKASPKYQIAELRQNDVNVTYTLTVNNVTTSDNGSFLCMILRGTYPSEKADLLVLIPPKFETGTPRLIRGVEGGNATLFCNVSGTPTPTVTWTRLDRKPMPNGTSFFSGAKYFIQSVGRNDTGVYICKAENGVPPNPIHLDVQMEISYPATVREAVSEVGQQPNRGYDAHLLCIGTGFPSPTTRWYRVLNDDDDEKEIVADFKKFSMQIIAGVEKHSQDIQIQLSIHNVVEDDFGNYTCRVDNGHGIDNAYILFYRVASIPGAASHIESNALSDQTTKLNKKETRYVVDTNNGSVIVVSSVYLLVTLFLLIGVRIT